MYGQSPEFSVNITETRANVFRRPNLPLAPSLRTLLRPYGYSSPPAWKLPQNSLLPLPKSQINLHPTGSLGPTSNSILGQPYQCSAGGGLHCTNPQSLLHALKLLIQPCVHRVSKLVLLLQVDAGVDSELVLGDPTAPRFVFWNDKLRATPSGLDAVTFDLLSIWGKLRAGLGAIGLRPSMPGKITTFSSVEYGLALCYGLGALFLLRLRMSVV